MPEPDCAVSTGEVLVRSCIVEETERPSRSRALDGPAPAPPETSLEESSSSIDREPFRGSVDEGCNKSNICTLVTIHQQRYGEIGE